MSSIWDLHREIQNLTCNDSLRPRNRDKGPQWLSKRIKGLPRSCDMSTVASYKLCRLEFRTLWRDTARQHKQVVSALIEASNAAAPDRVYDCLFNRALKEMVTLIENFATRAAPFSISRVDNQFEILMENFGGVIDTISIFYDRFDCDGRSETLKLERDEKRMAGFRFEKNERQPPMNPSEIREAFKEVYGSDFDDSFLLVDIGSPFTGEINFDQYIDDNWDQTGVIDDSWMDQSYDANIRPMYRY